MPKRTSTASSCISGSTNSTNSPSGITEKPCRCCRKRLVASARRRNEGLRLPPRLPGVAALAVGDTDGFAVRSHHHANRPTLEPVGEILIHVARREADGTTHGAARQFLDGAGQRTRKTCGQLLRV